MRALRELQDGATYHVTSEINRNKRELKSVKVKTKFLTFIQEAKQKYPFKLLNFCIMDSHIHLFGLGRGSDTAKTGDTLNC